MLTALIEIVTDSTPTPLQCILSGDSKIPPNHQDFSNLIPNCGISANVQVPVFSTCARGEVNRSCLCVVT